MSRLIIISNRLPFTIDKSGDDIVVRQSSGGLVSAIKSYVERGDSKEEQQPFSGKIWIGGTDASAEDWKMVRDMNALPKDFTIEPVFMDAAVYSRFYNGFSNSTLWPLFHYFPSLVVYKQECYEAYKQANQVYADKIKEVYKPGDVVWVHDYQLLLVPQMVRESVSDASIGLFLHIPFPSYEIFRLLPTQWKKDILHGMLGADLIGFHTHDYVQYFIQSAKMILQVENQFNTIRYKGRMIKTDLFPIGIDYVKFRTAITDPVVTNIGVSLEDKFKGQKIIFSVDRLDYTKGLNYRLEGFRQFLEAHSGWREKVVFILNIIPSRDVIPTYIERKREIEEKVSMINGLFSTLHWQPLIYRYNHLSFEELCALYQTTDVALITPLRDGMNLVAKEYIASCIDKGVLILSEFTGAASELNEAILVNPTDSGEMADAIAEALSMPLVEQRSRLSYMQQRLANYDVVQWINEFLKEMHKTKEEQQKLKVNVLDDLTISKILEEYTNATKRCILLDYDGTLAPLQRLPSMAVPGADVLQLLKQLTDDPANEVVVISGRDTNTLDRWLHSLNLNLVAEHGACMKFKNESWKQQVSDPPVWKDNIRPLMELFVTRCVGSFVEEKQNTLAWHYRNTHPDLGFIRSRELRNSLLQLITNTALQVIDGNKVLEVRLAGIDKGATAQRLLAHFHPDFTLCIGDDVTDEDMFTVLRDQGYTIKVGSGNTIAKYTLLSQKDVFPLLNRLVTAAPKVPVS